jgi:hypothetical protein
MPPTLTFRDLPPDKFAYTMEEGRNALGVGKNALYDLIHAGELKPFPFCGRPHLHRDDLKAAADRAFISTHGHPPGQGAGLPAAPPAARRRRSTPA